MYRLLWLLIIVILPACDEFKTEIGSNESFIKFFEEGTGYDILQTSDGGFLCLGVSGTDLPIFAETKLIKTDANGNLLWMQSYTGLLGEGFIGVDFKILPSGDIVIVGGLITGEIGEITNFNANMAIIITNSRGIRQATFTPDFSSSGLKDTFGHAVTVDLDGNLLILGSYHDELDDSQMVLLKVDLSPLVTNWFQSYNDDGNWHSPAKSLHLTTSGYIIWAGSVTPLNNTTFLKIYATQPNSATINENVWGAILDEPNRTYSATDITATRDGGYIIVGSTMSLGLRNIYILKTDDLGNIIPGSERIFSSDFTGDDNMGPDFACSIVSTSDGGIVVLGTMTNKDVSKGRDFYLIKIDVFGKLAWTRIIGGEGVEAGGVIIETTDGGLVFFGTSTLQGVSRMTLVKTDRNGNIW